LVSIFFLLAIASVILMINITAINGSGNPGYVVLTKDSNPYNVPFSKWVEKWWMWWASIPVDLHPSKNYTDSGRCKSMQQGPVWFLRDLPEFPVTYPCEIPEGKAIFVPLTSTSCDTEVDAPAKTEADLKQCLEDNKAELVSASITLDGAKVAADKSVVNTGFFNVTYPENPIDVFDKTPNPGTYNAIANGNFLMIGNLSLGKHNLDINVIDKLPGSAGNNHPRMTNFEITVK